MAYNAEDLGFAQSYPLAMAAPLDIRTGSPDETTSPSTPTESIFGSSMESVTTEPLPTASAASDDHGDHDDHANHGHCSKNHCHPLPHHGRSFPRPEAEVNVEEALARKPHRWSVQGQRDANLRRAEVREAQQSAQATQEQERRRAELEKTKAELLAMKHEIGVLPRGRRGQP